MKVKVLDSHLVNKIAAGEVIERPASVVKELIENALDAQATKIEIAIEGGGVERIGISDNGEGMSQEDVLLAIQRHTTSKLASEEDLFQILTLGFRGEALASIVEVSKTSIVTRSNESREGIQVEIEAGQVKRLSTSARARGTTVDVRDLFFNLPARRKFLKTEKTELYHITRMVRRFVLAYSQVHFTLHYHHRQIFDAPPSNDLRGTIAHLYNPETARTLLQVHTAIPDLRVTGLVSPPQLTKTDRSEQFIFVNGRFVRDAQINYAISAAYERRLSSQQYPMVFLFLEIDPKSVDVNVHPRKEEVRFAEPIKVQALVKQAITAALTSAHAVPRFEKEPSPLPMREERTLPPLPPRGRSGARAVRSPAPLDLRQELEELKRSTLSAAAAEPTPAFRVLGHLHGTYILVQTESGLEIIDQHVAHERVLYERFLEQLQTQKIARQRLLIPVTLELSPDRAELLAGHLSMLDERLGIGLAHLGGATFVVREWPQILTSAWSKTDFQTTIEHLLALLEQEATPTLDELAKTIAARVACESAVVKHKPLTLQEMESLVRQLKATKNPYHCPHGRPIVLAYSLSELEKKFGRR
jgi:DNA mismatch repair protein MutL